MTTSQLIACLAALAATLCWSAPADAADGDNPHLEQGIKLLDQAEDEKALVQFQRALKRTGSPRAVRIRVHMYLGITYLNLLQEARAERHFRRALRRDVEFKLPAGVSPKITEMVERLRTEVRSAPPPRRPRRRPVRRRVRPAPVPISPSPMQPPVERRSGAVYWPALTALGVAVAAGGTGLALGVLARNKAADANDLSTPAGPAQETYDSAEQMALSANILFGVAGAAAVASGVLFYWGHRQGQSARVSSVGLAPLAEGGALVRLGGRF